jgi:hypothetical protein
VGLDADDELIGIYYGTLRGLVLEEIAVRTRRTAEAAIARLADAFQRPESKTRVARVSP